MAAIIEKDSIQEQWEEVRFRSLKAIEQGKGGEEGLTMVVMQI
jgi:hypothetical protein